MLRQPCAVNARSVPVRKSLTIRSMLAYVLCSDGVCMLMSWFETIEMPDHVSSFCFEISPCCNNVSLGSQSGSAKLLAPRSGLCSKLGAGCAARKPGSTEKKARHTHLKHPHVVSNVGSNIRPQRILTHCISSTLNRNEVGPLDTSLFRALN